MKNKKLFKGIAFGLCAATVLSTSAFFFADGETGSQGSTQTQTEFVPVFRMAVCSDIHVTTTNGNLRAKFEKIFDTAYAYAAGESYTELDAFVITGDLVHTEEAENYLELQEALLAKCKRSTELMIITGNHDDSSTYQEYISYDLSPHKVVDGFHLIGLETTDGTKGTYTEEQLAWLNAELAIAKADDPEKPIFTFQHFHLADTVFGSKGDYSSTGNYYFGNSGSSAELKAAYSQYPQVVNFSGHSHVVSASERQIWQGGFTAISVGSTSNSGVDKNDYAIKSAFDPSFDPTSTSVKPLTFDNSVDQNTTNVYRIVEVDASNRVRIRTYDMYTESLMRTPATTDGDAILEWTIDSFNTNDFKYTDDRFTTAAAPYFTEGASVTATATADGATIGFPQMQDESTPFGYKVVCTDGEGNETVFRYIDEFYMNAEGGAESFTLTGLTAATTYSVSVYPINIWGKVGTALVGSFTTL